MPAVDAYHEGLRRIGGVGRLKAAAALTAGVRALAAAGIAQRHPSADAAERQVRLVVRLYGRDVAERFYGHVPDDAR